MIHSEQIRKCIVYSRIWETDNLSNIIFYINGFELYKIMEADDEYRVDIDPMSALSQLFPTELFSEARNYGGYTVETLGDHATESTDWVDTIYAFDEDFDELVDNLKSTLNIMQLYIVLNYEFIDNHAKNHFKLKHGKILKKHP